MSNDDLLIFIVLGSLACLVLGFFILGIDKRERLNRRIQRVTTRQFAAKGEEAMLLRRKSQELPFISKVIRNFPTQAVLRVRLERAGLLLPADIYATASGGGAVFLFLLTVGLGKPPVLGVLIGLFVGIILPYLVIGYLGNRRLKKFLLMFPDAIDFIVRGLRSGLPVTESMNMLAVEMEEPIKSVFSDIGESVRLGVPLEKALQDMAKKLTTTEFNFFVTTIVMQRETGGNLSEILHNLAEVLRKRFMMRMKIKAMSSEAKASAIILGLMPFVVLISISFIAPDYLEPLINDFYGNLAAAGAALSLVTGMFIMIKMTQFEI